MSPDRKARPKEQSLLDMSAARARAHLLKPESYCHVDLPAYFDFGGVLRPIARYLSATPLANPRDARRHQDVNYTIYSNKDGRFAWRPFQLIHPALYVNLVHLLTEPAAWREITARFQAFAEDERIRCLSLPVASLSDMSDKGAQITHWWHGVEQASIASALDFGLLFHADISECYASIYTHSIAWALHERDVAKARQQDDTLLGNALDKRVQEMRHGQTNGIPQGSVLVDLIAELVLGYADLLVSRRLSADGIVGFKVLRFRDDYRVFVNDTKTGETILRVLTEVLMDLGLKLNASKTTGFQAVIDASIKVDKRAWMDVKSDGRSLQEHLLLIHAHGRRFPNAGSLIRALDGFRLRLGRQSRIPDAVELISIAVDIGYSNPRCFPVCAAVVSGLLRSLKAKSRKLDVVRRIRGKLDTLPNSGHLELWLQRISYPFDSALEFSDGLCRVVRGESTDLWNSDWISNPTLKALVDSRKVVNRRKLKTIRPVVPRSEFTPFVIY